MEKKVKIYSTSTCPHCIRAKQFLKDNKVDFLDIDVSGDKAAAEEMINKTGQMGVPVLEIDGEIIVGFDKERIQQVLGI